MWDFVNPQMKLLGQENRGIFLSASYEFINADSALVTRNKSVEYSRPQHSVEFQCEVVVADPWRLILSAGPGTLFWTGQRGVSPQLNKTSLSEVDGAEPGLLTEDIAATSTQRVSLHQAVSRREEVCIVSDLRRLLLQSWTGDILLPPSWRCGLVSSQNRWSRTYKKKIHVHSTPELRRTVCHYGKDLYYK